MNENESNFTLLRRSVCAQDETIPHEGAEARRVAEALRFHFRQGCDGYCVEGRYCNCQRTASQRVADLAEMDARARSWFLVLVVSILVGLLVGPFVAQALDWVLG